MLVGINFIIRCIFYAVFGISVATFFQINEASAEDFEEINQLYSDELAQIDKPSIVILWHPIHENRVLFSKYESLIAKNTTIEFTLTQPINAEVDLKNLSFKMCGNRNSKTHYEVLSRYASQSLGFYEGQSSIQAGKIWLPDCLKLPKSYRLARYHMPDTTTVNFPASVLSEIVRLNGTVRASYLRHLHETGFTNELTVEAIRKDITDQNTDDTKQLLNAHFSFLNGKRKRTSNGQYNLKATDTYWDTVLPQLDAYELAPNRIDSYLKADEFIVEDDSVDIIYFYRPVSFKEDNSYLSIEAFNYDCVGTKAQIGKGLSEENIYLGLGKSIRHLTTSFEQDNSDRSRSLLVIDQGFAASKSLPYNFGNRDIKNTVQGIEMKSDHGTAVASVALGSGEYGNLISIYNRSNILEMELLALPNSGGLTKFSPVILEKITDSYLGKFDVVNMSLGTRRNNTGVFFADLITESKNLPLMIFPSGNAGAVIDRGSENDWLTKIANHENRKSHVIVVGALNESGNALASFSNKSKEHVDIAAPGSCLMVSKKRGDLDVENILSADLIDSLDSGTSYAAPFVAFTAWLLETIYPDDISPLVTKKRISKSADRNPILKQAVKDSKSLNIVKAISIYEDIIEHEDGSYHYGNLQVLDNGPAQTPFSSIQKIPFNCGGVDLKYRLRDIAKIYQNHSTKYDHSLKKMVVVDNTKSYSMIFESDPNYTEYHNCNADIYKYRLKQTDGSVVELTADKIIDITTKEDF